MDTIIPDNDDARERAGEGQADTRGRFKELLRRWTEGWKATIDTAWKFKEDKFSKDAAEAFAFFGSDHSFLFDPSDDRSLVKRGVIQDVHPGFIMTYNIVAELVQLFGPAIYHRNPNRECIPVLPLELRREAYVDPRLEHRFETVKSKAMQYVQAGSAQLAARMVASGMPESQAAQQAAAALQQTPEFQSLAAEASQLEAEIYAQEERWKSSNAYQKAKLTRSYTKSDIMARLLNYFPEKCDLRTNSRRVVDETLIKGEGVWWTSLKVSADGKQIIPGSFYKSIDHFLIDCDVENEEDAMWVAERCIDPVWKVEEEYGYEPGQLKGNYCSDAVSRGKGTGDAWQPKQYGGRAQKGQTNDLLVYWKVYSKMGPGPHLYAIAKGAADEAIVEQMLPLFSDNCMLVIAEGVEHPINLKPDVLLEADPSQPIVDAEWPTPFWKVGQWPCTTLAFHWVAGSPYGMSHLKPGIGELKFLDWAMSHVAAKMQTACDDIIGVIEAAGDDIAKQLNTRKSSGYKVVKVPSHFGKSVQEIFSAIQMPPFHGDIWNVIAAVAQRLDKRLGLTELAYGLASTQSRSALDSQFKHQQYSIRPDDMAAQVEEKASILAMKEAFAIAYHGEAQDVLPALGEAAAELYAELIASEPAEEIVRQFDYRITANSIRRPNKDRDIENMNLTTQVFLPIIAQYSASTGNYGPLNWYKKQYEKVYDIDATELTFTPPQPPPQPDPTPAQLEAMRLGEQTARMNLLAEQQKAQNAIVQLQVKQVELQASANAADLKLAEQVQQLRHSAEQHQQKLEQRAADHHQNLQFDAERHDQEMQQDREQFSVTGRNTGEHSWQ